MSLSKNKQITIQINQVTEMVNHLLGDILIGIYLFGSSVTGGLRPHSDLDILVLTQESIPLAIRQNMLSKLLNISENHTVQGMRRPIELTTIVLRDIIPWQYPPKSDFVFGEWLRSDFEAGVIPAPTTDPDLTLVLATALKEHKTLAGLPITHYISAIPVIDIRQAIHDSLPLLISGLQGDERNVILTLARMWYTLATGDFVPKDIAAQWALQYLPNKYHPILTLAREAYLGQIKEIGINHKNEVEAFVSFVTQQIKKAKNNMEKSV